MAQQLVQTCVLALSAQFQGFCRDLHLEAVRQLVSLIPLAPLAALFQ